MAAAHVNCLRNAASRTLRTAEDVEVVLDAAEQLVSSRHRCATSSWEVAKMLSSVLRTQINARSCTSAEETHGVSVVALCRLLALAWRTCPLESLPLPRAVADSAHGVVSLLQLSEDDVERVWREAAMLKGSTARPSVGDVAMAVVASLLLYWHVLAAEATAGEEAHDAVFGGVSIMVWRAVVRWTGTDERAGSRGVCVSTWLCTVMRRAVQCASDTSATSAVTLLDAASCCGAGASAIARVTGCSALNDELRKMWAQLRLRVCRRAAADVRVRLAAAAQEWRRTVVPVLTHAFAREPPLLSPAFTDAPQFAEPLDDTLHALAHAVERVRRCTLGGEATAAADDVAPLTCAEALRPAVRIAAVSRWLTAAGVPAAPAVGAEPYRAYVAPLVAAALRWGLFADASALLHELGDEADEHVAQWRRRLRCLLDSDPPAQLTLPGVAGAHHIDEGGVLYGEWLQRLPCTPPAAVDVLVFSDDVAQLRPVCDALLRRRPVGWAAAVLRDAYAPAFLLDGVARLAEALLRVRDAPLARFYVSVLGRLLPRCLCLLPLSALLRLVHRLAVVLTTHTLTTAAPAGCRRGSALAEWRRLRVALERVGCTGEGTAAMRRGVVEAPGKAGSSWDARRRRQALCIPPHSNSSSSSSSSSRSGNGGNSSGTVVEVRYVATGAPEDGRGWLRLRRTRLAEHVDGAPSSLFSVHCCVGGALHACAADIADVVSRNRAQLLRGTVAVAGEAGRRPDHHDRRDGATGAVTSETEAQRDRRCKETWWCERFALDARVGGVAAAMRTALGAARLLLLGHLDDHLHDALRTLADSFAADCARHRGVSRCPPMDELRWSTLQALEAAPCAWGEAALPHGPSACWYGCTDPRSRCARCASTLKRARGTLLEVIVALGQLCVRCPSASRPQSPGSTPTEDVRLEEARWLDMLVDEGVQHLVNELVPAVLDAYCASLLPAAESAAAVTGEDAHRRRHADLMLLPREHVYLVLDDELHTLPWEALRVLEGRSVSRAPSLAYLVHSSRTTRAVSLRRALVYRDDEALRQAPSSLAELLVERPAWEVAYGDTLHATTAAALPDAAAAPRLLHRLVQAEADDHLDVFVYAGHKGGEHLLSRAALYEWLPAAAGTPATLVLLMGCSSARMQGGALYDSVGLPHAYLSAGVPCALACLWDVTDADVDRLTARFLCRAAEPPHDGGSGAITVGECLAVARRACKLRYLTGMATVMFGVNCPMSATVAAHDSDSSSTATET